MKRLVFLTVVLMAVTLAAGACAEEAKPGHLAGKWVTKSNGPMSGGMAYFFNVASGPVPSFNKYWRIPDEIADLDKNGQFTGELLPGTYYLGLVKRVKGKGIGPPADGDFFFFSADQKGNPKVYTVSKGETTSIGTIAEAVSFKLERTQDTTTAIEGIVTDVEGKPVQGMLVFAFLTPAMVGRPMYVSDKTGPEGKYLLRVKEGGNYYLKVREDYGGGQPIVGEMVGGYGEKAPTPVNVKTATITKGVDLKATRFLGRGPKRTEH